MFDATRYRQPRFTVYAGADLGGVRWVRTNPPFYRLTVTPSVFDTQRLRARLLRPIARIDIAIGVLVICSIFFARGS